MLWMKQMTDKVGLIIRRKIIAFDTTAILKESYQVSAEEVFLKQKVSKMRTIAIAK